MEHASLSYAAAVTPASIAWIRPPTCAHVMPRHAYTSSNAALTAAKSE